MQKLIGGLFIIVLLSILSPTSTHAAKKFIPKKVINYKSTSRGSLPALVKYMGNKQGIYLSFANFSGIESISYAFNYTTNGNPQGAGGVITSANNPTRQRELLFGTCSTSVCTYHHNLSNAKLILTAKLTNGKTVSKSYRIKTYQ